MGKKSLVFGVCVLMVLLIVFSSGCLEEIFESDEEEETEKESSPEEQEGGTGTSETAPVGYISVIVINDYPDGCDVEVDVSCSIGWSEHFYFHEYGESWSDGRLYNCGEYNFSVSWLYKSPLIPGYGSWDSDYEWVELTYNGEVKTIVFHCVPPDYD